MKPDRKGRIAVLLLLVLLCALGGCSPKAENSAPVSSGLSSEQEMPEKKPCRIGLIQYGEGPVQDTVREAFMSRLEEWNCGEDLLSIDYRNSGGDKDKAGEICKSFVKDEADIIVAISSSAAEIVLEQAKDSGIPVLFASGKEIEAGGNAAGVIGKPEVRATLEVALAADEKLTVLGFLYDPEDPESLMALEEAKAFCTEKNITLEESPVSEQAKGAEAMAELCKKAGAVYTLGGSLDAVTGAIAAEAIKAGKPWYAGTESMVQAGALAAVSINHWEMGNKLADLVVQRIAGQEKGSVETLSSVHLYVNQGTLGQLPLKMPGEQLQDAYLYTETVKEAGKAA